MHHIEKSFQINEINSRVAESMGVSLFVARLDKIHPIVSGNKLFKLHYFIEQAKECNHDTIITFGGSYSNHLVATAYYAHSIGLKSIGIVRGEKPDTLSHTLIDCMLYNMELNFVSRELYVQQDKSEFVKKIRKKYPNSTIIPEGGYHPNGAEGASIIMEAIHPMEVTHVATAVGTATTLAGLLRNTQEQEIIAVPVIKNMTDIHSRLDYLNQNVPFNQPLIFEEYHFGGYAKYDDQLLHFIHDFNREHQIMTDFIYTGKMFYAIMDKIKNGYFKKGSKIVCLHTGGIQGNFSIPNTSIIFK